MIVVYVSSFREGSHRGGLIGFVVESAHTDVDGSVVAVVIAVKAVEGNL